MVGGQPPPAATMENRGSLMKREEQGQLIEQGPGWVPDARRKAVLCARVLSRFKASDIVLLEVAGLSSFTDFFLICSGKSSRQVQGISDNLESSLKEWGIKPMGTEGRAEGHWILMDYSDVVVHIFYEPIRHFYDLESLWSEAAPVAWEEGSEWDVEDGMRSEP